MTIVEFLTARLDEREVHARAEVEITEAIARDGASARYLWGRITTNAQGQDVSFRQAEGAPTPEQVLADIAAKRAIIAAHQQHEERTAFALALDLSPAHPDQRRDATWEVLRHLASVDSDHPDYRQEWALE